MTNENALLFPAGIQISGLTGAVSPATGQYEKRLSELREIFADKAAFDHAVKEQNDPLVYRVVEYRPPQSDIFFGTTTMFPGHVGGEFYMTRGHFHARRDMGEIYYTQSGNGLLLLESREGDSRTVEMKPGVCAFIPPDWAHRSINIGDEPLVFVWACNPEAGHDYADILKRGMRKRIMNEGGAVRIVDNTAYA
jgi:glucose-6-phosphate isomerase